MSRRRVAFGAVVALVVSVAGLGTADAATPANLTVTSASGPARVAVGGAGTFTAVVRNAGGTRAGATSTVLRLSSDAAVGNDRALGAISTPILAAGASRTVTASVTVPPGTPRGRYYVVACADGKGAVAESRENDNCRVSTSRVLVDGRPDAVNDPASSLPSTLEDTAVLVSRAALLANDTDPEGDALTITAVTGSPQAAVSLGVGGVTVTPAANVNGTVQFSYTVTDGASSDTATATVTVTPVNDAPVAGNDSVTAEEDVLYVVPSADLLVNDTDAEVEPLEVTAAVALTADMATAIVGTDLQVEPRDPGFSGEVQVVYLVADPQGALDVGLVTIDVVPVADAPVAVDDTFPAAVDGNAVSGSVASLLANDTDEDGTDGLTITAVGNAVGGTVALEDGTVTFTPTPDEYGPATFEYTVSDGERTDTGVVTVPRRSKPVAGTDILGSLPADPTVVIPISTLLANDTDADSDTLSFDGFSGGGFANGSAQVVGSNVVFTPTTLGTLAAFVYRVTDDDGLTALGSVFFTPVAG